MGYGSILSAVAWANVSFNDNPENLAPNWPAPNTVTFDRTNLFSSAQTLTLVTGPLVFSNLTTAEAVEGTGINSLTISGGNSVQIFKVRRGSEGHPGRHDAYRRHASSGGAVDNFGSLTINGSMIQDNSAATFGGGVRNEASASLSVLDSTFSGDSASQGVRHLQQRHAHRLRFQLDE